MKANHVAHGPTTCELEQVILGSVIETNGSKLPDCISRLIEHAPDSFSDLRCGRVAVAVRALRGRGGAVHPAAIAEAISNQADFLDSALFVADLPNHALRLDAAEFESEKLWQAYRARRTKSLFSEAGTALDSGGKLDAVLHGVQAEIGRLSNESRNGHALTICQPEQILSLPVDPCACLLGDYLMSKGNLFAMLGQGGIGKSRLALQLAACMITGRDFLGLATHGRGLRWLFLQTENGIHRQKFDLGHLKGFCAQDWPLVNENLFLHVLESDRDGFLSLESEQNQKDVSDSVERVRPDFVVFDPLKDIGFGDLNKDADMAATLQMIQRLVKRGNPKRVPVTLHHSLTGRAGQLRATGIERSSFGRNSKVLLATARGVLNVTPISEDNNTLLCLSCGKNSDGKEFPAVAARLNEARMIYELAPDVDLEAWRSEISNKKLPLMTTEIVAELCGPMMTRDALRKAIEARCGCSRATGYRHIAKAERCGKIRRDKKTDCFNPA